MTTGDDLIREGLLRRDDSVSAASDTLMDIIETFSGPVEEPTATVADLHEDKAATHDDRLAA